MMIATSDKNSTMLHGLSLALARIAWVVIFLLSLSLFTLGMWDKINTPLPVDCASLVCNPVEFTGNDLAIMQASDLPERLLRVFSLLLNLLFNLGFILVAFVLAWRKSDDWLALILSATLVILGGVAFSPANDVLYRTRPMFGPLLNWLQQPAYFSLFFLLLVFPDGRFVPRWSWIFAIPMILAIIGLNVSSDQIIESNSWLSVPIYLTYILAVISFQIFRYRRVSNPIQHQQTKWGLVGILGAFLIMVAWTLLSLLFPPDQPTMSRVIALLIIWPLLAFLGFLMPVSFAIAVLRYRLWDIDLIIRRTFQYTLLTGVLALVYFGAVILLQQLFRGLTGQADSPIAVVLSTLFIAALFNPIRTRIQDFIDRRFYRRKYDADQTLVKFAQTTQEDVEMERLTGEIIQIIQDTLNPEHASIWFTSIPSEELKE